MLYNNCVDLTRARARLWGLDVLAWARANHASRYPVAGLWDDDARAT